MEHEHIGELESRMDPRNSGANRASASMMHCPTSNRNATLPQVVDKSCGGDVAKATECPPLGNATTAPFSATTTSTNRGHRPPVGGH